MLSKIVQTDMRSEIKLMYKLMRRANAEFPRISPYRVSKRMGRKNLDDHYIAWINKIGDVVDFQRAKDDGKSFLDIIFPIVVLPHEGIPMSTIFVFDLSTFS